MIPGTAATNDFTIAPGYAVTSPAQPDLWAQNATDVPIGKGIANETGAGQSISMSSRNRRSLSGTVGITTLNAGNGVMSLQGTSGNRHFKTKYYLNGNVSAAMNAGTLVIPASSGGQAVEVLVIPNGRSRGPAKARAKSLTLQISGTSLPAREASDLVILRATANPRR